MRKSKFSPLVYGAHSTQHFSDKNFNQTFMFICSAEFDSEYSKVMNCLKVGLSLQKLTIIM